MTDLVPSVVTLGQGLNLYSSPISAPVGSLLSCENYEITDSEGIRRMDGMEPLDGRVSPSTTLFYKLTTSSGTLPSVGDILVYTEINAGGKVTLTSIDIVAGKVVYVSGLYFIMATVNDNFLDNDVNLGIYDVTTGAVTAVGNVTTVELYEDTETDSTTAFAAIRSYFDTLRGDITSLGNVASGLHWFRDRYIAVAPVPLLTITGRTGGGSTSSGSWTFDAPNGSIVGNSVNTAKAYLANLTFITGSPSGIRRYYADIYMVRGTYKEWDDAMNAGATLTGVTITPGGFATVTNATGEVGAGTSTSSGVLWEALDEQQAINSGELPLQLGWNPIETNFTLSFSNGTYTSSDIPKLERSFETIPTTATYYLYDGVNIISFDLVSYFVDDNTGGDFATANANGTMQIRNLVVISGNYDTIDSTYDIHTANPPLVGNKLADVSVTMAPNSLPIVAALEEANSRYLFTTNNFYGDDSWDAMYGVNGVGRAFYYDGNLFANIFTQASATADIPRHISAHHQHLALGFAPGSVQISVIGEPHNFSGLDGASEHSLGDKITGMLPLNGSTLGVFCEQSIWSISGTDVDNFQTGVISPNSGCLEYTLVDMGYPVFCNNFGVRTLEQTAAYGDFKGQLLSQNVGRWVRRRLRRVGGHFNNISSVVAALPVRGKNQYRLYFRDGYVLTMTLVGDNTPQFTMQRPKIFDGNLMNFVPYALCSQMDSSGKERIAASFLDTKSNLSSTYVYELDSGWGWSGYPMEANFELNFFFGESPSSYTNVQKARLYGLSHGLASLKIQSSGALTQLTSRYNSTTEKIDMPNTPEVWLPEEVQRNSKPATLGKGGLAVQLKISNRQSILTEPSHTCQVLVLATTPGGAFDV